MAEAKKKSRISRLVSWVQTKLAKSGIGTFSKRAVKIGLVVTGVLALLIVANLLSRQAEPAFERALGASVTQPVRTADVAAKVDQISVQQESLRQAVIELGDTCQPAAPEPAVIRTIVIPAKSPPPAPVRRSEAAEGSVPKWVEKAFGQSP